MKFRIVSLCLAFVLLVLSLSACRAQQSEENKPDVSASAQNEEYLARIKELEAELAREREEKYISDSAYRSRISELENKPASASGEEESVVLHYVKEDGSVTITGYEGNSPLVSIPSVLEGAPVVAIGDRAFEGAAVSSVVLPESVRSIGWFAFYGCTGLLDVRIPASVSEMGYGIFEGCPSVLVVCAPDSYAEKYAHSYGIATRSL